MLAIIQTGGKQYKVKEGGVIKVEKLPGSAGDAIKFNKVLLLADEKGEDVKCGRPHLENTKVVGKILEQGRDKKVLVVKYKPKVRYRRKAGHRQFYTKVKIEKIEAAV